MDLNDKGSIVIQEEDNNDLNSEYGGNGYQSGQLEDI
jgi:hypothetical protein